MFVYLLIALFSLHVDLFARDGSFLASYKKKTRTALASVYHPQYIGDRMRGIDPFKEATV